MSLNEWINQQKKYLNSLEKDKLIALRLYSQSHLSPILNNFCNQIINIEEIYGFSVNHSSDDKLFIDYCKLKGINELPISYFDGKHNPKTPSKIEKLHFTFIMEVIKILIKDLIEIIENAPSTNIDLNLKRGTTHYYFSKDSSTLLNYSFVSTSLSEEVASGFSGSSCCMFNIKLPKNSKAIYISLLEKLKYEEYEILLLPYSSFKLVDITKIKTNWYELSRPDEYNVIYEGSNNYYYNQFNIYITLMQSIYFDKDSKKVENILDNNPINMTISLFDNIYTHDIFTQEICNVILNKKINVEYNYIIFAINKSIDFYTITSLINNFKEFGDIKKLDKIVNACIKKDHLEIIRFLNLYYKKYMDELDNLSKSKILKWFKNLF